jgi:hypothetical protein
MIRFSLKKSSWCSGTPIYRKWNAYNFPPPPFILVPAWAWMRSSEYSTRPSIWFSHSSPWSFVPLLSPRRSLRKTRDCIIFFFTNLARSMCTLFVGVCSVPLMYKWYRECPWWVWNKAYAKWLSNELPRSSFTRSWTNLNAPSVFFVISKPHSQVKVNDCWI